MIRCRTEGAAPYSDGVLDLDMRTDRIFGLGVGNRVAAAGDVNADGRPDLLAGAFFSSDAFLWLGGATAE